MLFCGVEVSLSKRHGQSTAGARYCMCESNTVALCYSDGKDIMQIFSNKAGHSMCELVVIWTWFQVLDFPEKLQSYTGCLKSLNTLRATLFHITEGVLQVNTNACTVFTFCTTPSQSAQ